MGIPGGEIMSERRYASDYRLEDYVTPKGGMATRRIYQGVYYRFCQAEAVIHGLGRKLCLLGLAMLVCLLPMLFNNTQVGRTIYILLPIAFTLIPIYHTVAAGIRLLRVRQPLTRQMRDLTDRRLRRASIWLTVMLGLDVLGCVVYWILRGLQGGEAACIAGIALAFTLSFFVLRLRGEARTESIEESSQP